MIVCNPITDTGSDDRDLVSLMEAYLRLLSAKGFTATTRRHRREQLMIFIRWADGHGITHCDQLDNVALNDFRRYISKKIDRSGYRWAPTMQTRTLNCIATWIGWMQSDEWISDVQCCALRYRADRSS